jgi:hypothetical protein
MKNKKKTALHRLILGNQREEQKKQGFFDGRFIQRKEELKTRYKRNPKHKGLNDE